MSSTITAGFIDLATYDEPETYLYGGGDAVTYFVRQHCRSTWFTLVPTVLSKSSGQPGFNSDWSVNISRAGDYLVHTWMRICIPDITFTAPPAPNGSQGNGKWVLRWSRNLAHNLVHSARITFNDLQAEELTSHVFDVERAFGLDHAKSDAYDNMIGDVHVLNGGVEDGQTLKGTILNLPLNFFFTKDTGVALPTAALPYNEMKLNFTFKDWSDLLVMDWVVDNVPAPSAPAHASFFTPSQPVKDVARLNNVTPVLKADVMAHYAIVANEERGRMANNFRDILIEQYQFNHKAVWDPSNSAVQHVDIRFSHPVKTLFFNIKNCTNCNDHSNYGVASHVVKRNLTEHGEPFYTLDHSPDLQADPLESVNILYENTSRVNMGVDYFALVNPYYHGQRIPTEHGYHMYSYHLHNYKDLDPKGSTNYGKLTNVSLQFTSTEDAQKYASASHITSNQALNYSAHPYKVRSGVINAQKYEIQVAALAMNLIRVAGGAMGFINV